MHKDISTTTEKEFHITESGDYVFYFENFSGKLNFIISSENAHVKIYGLYTGVENETYKLNITQKHTAPNSSSETIIKSMLNDASSLDFIGTIHIANSARNTEAHLTNTNLLLSNNASAKSLPQLEVLPHEVVCTHAATTAPLDQKQLQYLIMRGISQERAEKLLTKGFAQEILQHKNK